MQAMQNWHQHRETLAAAYDTLSFHTSEHRDHYIVSHVQLSAMPNGLYEMRKSKETLGEIVAKIPILLG